MKANKTLMAMLAVGGLLAFSPMLHAADTNAPAVPPANSPTNARAGRMLGPNLDQLAKDLNLTDDQKAKVKPVLEDQQQKRRQLFQDMRDGKVERSDMRTKMQAIQDDTDKQLKDAGLTQDQIDKFNQMTGSRNRRGPRGGENNTNAPAANPPQQ
jgi:periplasmic protein CpxP/Spy